MELITHIGALGGGSVVFAGLNSLHEKSAKAFKDFLFGVLTGTNNYLCTVCKKRKM